MRRVVAGLLLSWSAMLAQAPLHLTLAEAEQAAIKNYPRLEAARMQAQAAGMVPKEIRSQYLPALSGAVTGVGADSGSRLAAGALTNPVIYNRVGTGLILSETLTDFGRMSRLAESAASHAQALRELTDDVRAQLLLDVRRVYLSELRAVALTDVAQRTVEARQLVYDQVSTLAKNGLKSELDARMAAVNVSDAKLLLADATNRVQAAAAELSALTGLPAPAGFRLEEPPPVLDLPDFETSVQNSMRLRPDMQALRSEQLSAERQVAADKALWYPTIQAVGAAGFAPVADDQVRNHYGAFGVNVSIPILNGGLFKARRQESEYRALAAAQQVRDLELRVRRDARVAWLNLMTARERVTLAAQLVEQARMALDLAQGRYDLGLGSMVELSQSQLTLTSAEVAQTSARYDAAIGRAELDYQLGLAR